MLGGVDGYEIKQNEAPLTAKVKCCELVELCQRWGKCLGSFSTNVIVCVWIGLDLIGFDCCWEEWMDMK